jgi:hypothetical protein
LLRSSGRKPEAQLRLAPTDTKPVPSGFHSFACAWVTLLSVALAAPAAAQSPPLLRDPEPSALPRAPERLRAPIELVPQGVVTLPMCRSGSDAERCGSLGPGFGPELAGFYRPSPYFAFGGSFGYSRAQGSFRGAALSSSLIEASIVGRVYLLEQGAFDPYLEALVGWASERVTLAWPSGYNDADSGFGPFGRAGGGVDWFVGSGVKLGVFGAYDELAFVGGARCRAGQCATDGVPSSLLRGAVTLGVGISVLLGDAL